MTKHPFLPYTCIYKQDDKSQKLKIVPHNFASYYLIVMTDANRIQEHATILHGAG